MTRTRPIRHAALILALLAWVAGLTGSHVHALEVAHVRCVEHGEVVEASGHGGDSVDIAWASAPSQPGDHDHGCSLASASWTPASTAGSSALPELAGVGTVGLLACHQAPRGPPLIDAPKTSPPTS